MGSIIYIICDKEFEKVRSKMYKQMYFSTTLFECG